MFSGIEKGTDCIGTFEVTGRRGGHGLYGSGPEHEGFMTSEDFKGGFSGVCEEDVRRHFCWDCSELFYLPGPFLWEFVHCCLHFCLFVREFVDLRRSSF